MSVQVQKAPKLFRDVAPVRPVVNRTEPTEYAKKLRTIGLGVRPNTEKIKALGLGALGSKESRQETGLGDLVDAIRESVKCPIWNMPVIESSRGTFLGPMLDADLNRLFGSRIDPFNWTDSTEGLDQLDTTLAQNGELQTPTLVCAVGWHPMADPAGFSIIGNAWTHPEQSVNSHPGSPDVFTLNDSNNNVFGLDTDAGETLEPATLAWGWPFLYAIWQQARGYHLRWMIGQHTNIFDEFLRNTAYMPTNAQEGSASSSEVDTMFFIRRTNNRYDQLGSAMDFLPVTHIRIGSTGAGAGNIGVFHPSRSGDLAPVTYGGIDLRKLLGNTSEFKKLTIPYFLNAGIPIGLKAQESDKAQADLMRAYLSITYGLGVNIPPQVTPDLNITPGFTATGTGIMNEQTLDVTTPTLESQGIPTQRRMFKGGEFKISIHLKGFEVDADWYTMLKNNADLRDAFLCECGCAWPK
jgi:hypothetical protein